MRIRSVALRTRLLYLAAAAFVPVALMSGVSLLALLDGYELARRIRADLQGNRSREAGFDMHLVKPVDTATLADVLARR